MKFEDIDKTKKFRLKCWEKSDYIYLKNSIYPDEHNIFYCMYNELYLSNDWEYYQPKKYPFKDLDHTKKIRLSHWAENSYIYFKDGSWYRNNGKFFVLHEVCVLEDEWEYYNV